MKPTPLRKATTQAYPDFDDKKAAAYGGLVKDFTTGQRAVHLTAYGRQSITPAHVTTNGAEILHARYKRYKRYHQDVTYVATEVAEGTESGGVAAEGTIKEQEEA